VRVSEAVVEGVSVGLADWLGDSEGDVVSVGLTLGDGEKDGVVEELGVREGLGVVEGVGGSTITCRSAVGHHYNAL
jgi:hypothetical protein